MLETTKIIGIDIGGTKINIGLLENGKILNSLKLKTPSTSSQDGVIKYLIDGIEQLPGYEQAIGIGIGAPGLIDEKNGIIFSVNNIPSWKEVHLRDALFQHFNKPVYLTNDANCFAIGVKIFGEGKPFKNLVGLSLGTGVGAGIIIDDYLYSGKMSCAGEFGGLPYLDRDFETYCSGKFFKEFHQLSGAEAYQLAKSGDESALKAFKELGIHIGSLIKQMVFVLAPEAVIIGGSVSESFDLWKDELWTTIQTFPYPKAIEGLVVEASKISKMSVIGAAAFFQNRYEKEKNHLIIN